MSKNKVENDDQFLEFMAVGILGFGAIAFLVSMLKYNPEIIFILFSGFIAGSYLKYLIKFKGNFKAGSILILSMFLSIVWFIYWFYREAFLKIGNNSNKANQILNNMYKNYGHEIDLNWYVGAFLIGASLYGLFYHFVIKGEDNKNGSIYDVFCGAWNLEWRRVKIDDTKIYIGDDKFEKSPVYLPINDMARHIQIMGGTGAGKTNLLKNMIEPLIEKSESVIFLDMKAEKEMVTWLKNTHKLYKKEENFSLISTNSPKESTSIHPVKKEDLSDLVSMIMGSMEWSESYYKNQSLTALNLVIGYYKKIQNDEKKYININDIIDLLTKPEYFKSLEKKYEVFNGKMLERNEFASNLYSADMIKDTAGLRSQLNNLKNSSLGENFCSSKQEDKSLAEMVENGGLVYVQLNAMKNEDSARLSGKLLLQDLINTVGEKNANGEQFSNKKCTLIIDEFSDFATDNFIKLLNKCRGAGMGVIIAYQSSGDLEHVSRVFAKRVSSNCGIKFFFGTNDPEEAEDMSKRVGTVKGTKMTQKILEDIVQEVGSIRDVEEFLIHPNDVKNMEIGEVLMLNKWSDTQKYALLKAPLSREYIKNEGMTWDEFVAISHYKIHYDLGPWKPKFNENGYWRHEDFFYDPLYHNEPYYGHFDDGKPKYVDRIIDRGKYDY